MKTRFVDTSYLIAFTSPRDKHHALAMKLSRSFESIRLLTTGEVLVEYLNHFSARGTALRNLAMQAVGLLVADSRITVFPQTREAFRAACDFYRARRDKEFSLTDCVSMNRMRAERIDEIRTSDHHFEQEGFTILLKD